MSTNAKVLFFSTMDGVPWGGSEQLWFETALRMADRGRPVAASVVKWPNPPEQISVLRGRKIPVMERSAAPAPVRAIYKVYKGLKYDWLRRLAPRFVVLSQGSNWSEHTIEWLAAIRRFGFPYVVISQSAFPWHWPADAEAAEMRKAFESARASYFVSQSNLSLTERQVGSPLVNAKVIRNPFGVDYNAPLPWPEDGTTRLAFVARLYPGVKGHDLLFEALAGGPWRGRDIAVTLYGAGPNAEIVRRMQQRLGLEQVRFGGFVSPREIWQHNHALILPSRAEGLAVTVVEAMLCGRPCIVTDVGGNAEAIEDGETGFLAREVSPSGIDEALERAWSRRGEWKLMGEKAARRIRTLVPPDPAGDFADELERLIGS
jgi:glycosyltransferase involved in cell wall biosynthesis